MKHLKPLNKKAWRIDDQVAAMREDVFAMQQGPQQRPHVPMGCALAFSPGWEVDLLWPGKASRSGDGEYSGSHVDIAKALERGAGRNLYGSYRRKGKVSTGRRFP